MKEYVLGFCFTQDLKSVWLIRKKRPIWQAGKFNGIGGHIEKGESPEEAMKREFQEEAGCSTLDWKKFGTLVDKRKWKVHLFRYISSSEETKPHTRTDEEVVAVSLSEINHMPLQIIPNLSWLIPMALEAPFGMRYEIKEDNDEARHED